MTKQRTARHELRLHPDELQAWKAKALKEGKNLSDFIRSKIGDSRESGIAKSVTRQRVQSIDPELIRELVKIGNNLNQIARALNICVKDGTAVQTVEVIMLLNSIQRDLSDVLPKLPEPPSKTRKTRNIANGEHLGDISDAH